MIADQEGIDADEIVLIHGLSTMDTEETLSAFGITAGKNPSIYLIINRPLLARIDNQPGSETVRWKEEEEEEDLHQAQEDRPQAQEETQGHP